MGTGMHSIVGMQVVAVRYGSISSTPESITYNIIHEGLRRCR